MRSFNRRTDVKKIRSENLGIDLYLLLVYRAFFIVTAAIADNQFNISTVHIQAKTVRPGFGDKRTDFDLDFIHRCKQPSRCEAPAGAPGRNVGKTGYDIHPRQEPYQNSQSCRASAPPPFLQPGQPPKQAGLVGILGKHLFSSERDKQKNGKSAETRKRKKCGMPHEAIATLVGRATPGRLFSKTVASGPMPPPKEGECFIQEVQNTSRPQQALSSMPNLAILR